MEVSLEWICIIHPPPESEPDFLARFSALVGRGFPDAEPAISPVISLCTYHRTDRELRTPGMKYTVL